MQRLANDYAKEFYRTSVGQKLVSVENTSKILGKFWKFYYSKVLSLENSSKKNQLNIIFQTPGIGKKVFKLNLL